MVGADSKCIGKIGIDRDQSSSICNRLFLYCIRCYIKHTTEFVTGTDEHEMIILIVKRKYDNQRVKKVSNVEISSIGKG